MKNKWVLIIVGYFLMNIVSVVQGEIPQGYKVKKDFFTISTNTPPALLYVVDSQGRRTGINPSYLSKIDQYGILEDLHGLLSEIPLSNSEQQNNGDPNNNFAPSPTTPCLITILDGGNQTYTINLIGITQGVQDIVVQDAPLTPLPKAPQNEFFVLIQPNGVKQINVAVNTDAHTTAITRVVGNSDLLSDVMIACQQNLITSKHVCKYLEKKAEAIQGALEDKNYKRAEELIWDFLHLLGDSRPAGCHDDDYHNVIEEPALTILKEDAKALSAQLEENQKHPHHNHDDGR